MALLLIRGFGAPLATNMAIAPAELLRAHLVSEKRVIITDTNGSQIVWSDGVIVEITDSLPAPLRTLVNATPNHTDIRSTVQRVEAELHTDYHPSHLREKSSHEGYVEFEADHPQIRALLNPVYVAYVQARYPEASAVMKSRYDPVVFTVKGQIKALIMPVKLSNK